MGAILVRATESAAKRNDPANARDHRRAGDTAVHRIGELQAQAARAFGEINGWRTAANYNFTPDHLGHPDA